MLGRSRFHDVGFGGGDDGDADDGCQDPPSHRSGRGRVRSGIAFPPVAHAAQRGDAAGSSRLLTESTTLSIVGGLAGTTMGFGLAFIVSKLAPIPARVEVWSVILGIGMTAVVGLFFGLYPAIRAASLDPIEALRRE